MLSEFTETQQVLQACVEIVKRYAQDKYLYPETQLEIIESDDPLEYGREFAELFNIGPIRKNAVFCLDCEQEIESKHRHDFVTCDGGHVSVDGGTWYVRRAAKEGARFDSRLEHWPWSEKKEV